MTMMRPPSRRRQGQSGVAIILLSLMLCTILLPMIGLAFDLTIMYIVRAKLSAAVDAGVLAGGRSLIGSKTLAAQQTQVTNIALDFLNANMPAGYWGTTATPTVETSTSNIVTQDTTNARILVTLQASVKVPLVFLQYLQNTALVRSSAVAARRYLRMVIVLDRSSSMETTAGGCTLGTNCPIDNLKSAVSNTDPNNPGFVQDFFEGQDDLGLVVFGGSGIVAYPPRDPTIVGGGGSGPDSNFKTIADPAIPDLVPLLKAGSNTGTSEGLILAYKELQKNPQPLFYNVIVLFTDGMPNGFTAGWNGAAPSVLYSGDTGVVPTTLTSFIVSGGSQSTCTYKKYTDYTGGHQIVGWVSQWGGYANEQDNLHGIYGSMSNNKFPSGAYSSPAQDVENWLATGDPAGTKEYLLDSTNDGGCYFRIGGSTQMIANSDVASFPAGDIYGNGLLGTDYKASLEYNLKGGFGLDSSDVNNPYQIGNVSWNAAYQAAKRIRGDTTLRPTFYVIGYNGLDSIDHALLKRIANTNQGYQTWAQDPKGQYLQTDYDPTSTTGQYYDAGPGGIAAAFQQVRSQILSLAM